MEEVWLSRQRAVHQCTTKLVTPNGEKWKDISTSTVKRLAEAAISQNGGSDLMTLFRNGVTSAFLA